MPFTTGHLAEHPLPPGITGALALGGYQLLADVGGVGAGRLGPVVFLLLAADPDPRLPDASTHIVLLQRRLREESDAQAFVALAGTLGYLRLSGYRIALERHGLLSGATVVDPGTGAIVLELPPKHPGRLLGGAAGVTRLLAAARALPPAGPPPEPDGPDVLGQALLALALGDSSLDGAEAVEVADRALVLLRENRSLDPPAALAAAKRDRGGG